MRPSAGFLHTHFDALYLKTTLESTRNRTHLNLYKNLQKRTCMILNQCVSSSSVARLPRSPVSGEAKEKEGDSVVPGRTLQALYM